LFLRARARPAETVFVHGASGGVGTAVVQLARAHGLRIIATAGTDRGMQLVRDQGAHEVLNHREADYLTRVAAFAGGRGVDLVIEMLANVNLDRDLELLALHGRVMVVGNRGRVEIDPRKIMSKEGAILGMTMFNATAEEYRVIHAALAPGFENGTLAPVVGRELPLADAPRAHVAVMEPGAYGKIVLMT
jgi:NADPH2:quinone reductase